MATEQASATAPAAAPGKPKIPAIPEKVFKTKPELDKAAEEAKKAGHTYDTRKWRVVSADGKHTIFVMGYSQKDVAGRVHESLGIKVEELDPVEGGAGKATPQGVLNKFEGLSEEDKKLVMVTLNKRK